jgi:hypothetical protein
MIVQAVVIGCVVYTGVEGRNTWSARNPSGLVARDKFCIACEMGTLQNRSGARATTRIKLAYIAREADQLVTGQDQVG